MTAGTAQFVLPLSPRIVSPTVDPGQFFARHALCPSCMRHEIFRSGQRYALVLEIRVSETFQRAGVCDMGAGGVGSGIVSIDQYGWNIEVRKEDAGSSSTRPYMSAY